MTVGGFAAFALGAARGVAGAARIGARGASLAARSGSRAAPRTFSVAGKSGPVSRVKGFKPMPKPKPKPKPNPGEKGTIDPKKNPQGQDGMSAADGVSTAAGAVPPGGSSQSSGYGSAALEGLSSVGMAAAPSLAGAAGAFATSAATSAAEGTSPEALERAMEKGNQKGKNAAYAVTNGLKGIAASGSQTGTFTGKTGGIERMRNKLCLCPDDARKYMRAQRGLPEGLKELYGSYYRLESKCKCTEDNEKLEKYVLDQIVNSKNILMSNGREVGRTGLYKDTVEKVKPTQTRGRRGLPQGTAKKVKSTQPQGPRGLPVIGRGLPQGGYMRLAGTRKKSGHAMNKKSSTRKQQKTQFRRRTRKI